MRFREFTIVLLFSCSCGTVTASTEAEFESLANANYVSMKALNRVTHSCARIVESQGIEALNSKACVAMEDQIVDSDFGNLFSHAKYLATGFTKDGAQRIDKDEIAGEFIVFLKSINSKYQKIQKLTLGY